MRLNAHGQIREKLSLVEIATCLNFIVRTMIFEVEPVNSEVGVLIFNPHVLIFNSDSLTFNVEALSYIINSLSFKVEPVNSIVRVLTFNSAVLIFNSNPVNFIIKPLTFTGKGSVSHFESSARRSSASQASKPQSPLASACQTFKMWD